MFRYNDWNEKIPHHGEATFLGGCFSKSCKSSTFQRISKGEASFAREDYHVSSPLLGTRFAFGRSLSRRSPVMMKKNLMSHSSYWPHAWTWVMRNCLNGKIVSMVFWGGGPIHCIDGDTQYVYIKCSNTYLVLFLRHLHISYHKIFNPICGIYVYSYMSKNDVSKMLHLSSDHLNTQSWHKPWNAGWLIGIPVLADYNQSSPIQPINQVTQPI